jgi:hypothetical protein
MPRSDPQNSAINFRAKVTWLQVGSVCATIFVSLGTLIWLLLTVVYGNIHESLSKLDDRVNAIQQQVLKITNDTAYLQTLPELKKTLAETHDIVITHTDKLTDLNASVGRLTDMTSTMRDKIADLSTGISNIQAFVKNGISLRK